MKINIDVFFGSRKTRPDSEPNVRFTIDVQAEYCDTTINDAFKDEFIKKFMAGFCGCPRMSLPLESLRLLPTGISTEWLDCTKTGFNVFLTMNANCRSDNSQKIIHEDTHGGTEESLLICARFCDGE